MEINMERLKNQMTEVVTDLFGRFEGCKAVLYDRSYHGDVNIFDWHTNGSLLNTVIIDGDKISFCFGEQIKDVEVNFGELIALEIYRATSEHDFIRFYRYIDNERRWIGLDYYYEAIPYSSAFLDVLFDAIELWVSKRMELPIKEEYQLQSRHLSVKRPFLSKKLETYR